MPIIRYCCFPITLVENNENLKNIISDNGIILGTDPTEVYDKHKMIETYQEYSKDSVLADIMSSLSFDVLDRKVKVSDCGKQAIVIDVVDVNFSEMDVRSIAIMQNINDEWKITFSSMTFLLDNADMAKVDSLVIE